VNYTLIYLEDGTQKLYARTLANFQKLLINDPFIRVHQSYLANPIFILEYHEAENRLIMENNIEVTISRRKKKNLFALI
jgi:two-component system LytT family response regulator